VKRHRPILHARFCLPAALAENAGPALADLLPDGLLTSPLGSRSRSWRPGQATEGGLLCVEGWLKRKGDLPALKARVALLGGKGFEAELEAPRDWLTESKASFPVQKLGRFHVVPAWRKPVLPRGALAIRLLQGQAFGTGLHASTRLMLAALSRDKGLKGLRLLEIGAGSGILCFAALHLGAAHCDAVELEAGACRELKANRAENGVRPQALRALQGAFPRVAGLGRGRYPRVLANLTSPVLLKVMPALARRLALGGRLLMSGIHTPAEALAVGRAARAQGLALLEERRRGLWFQLTAGLH
jgi:ribosomal protein L11 methyltransferase